MTNLPNYNFEHLWLSGLRRSGTTAIWKMLRPVTRFQSYDEPFNPKLGVHLPQQHHKCTWDEFIQLWNNDFASFHDKLTPIHTADEVDPELNQASLDYLRYLSQTPTIIDFTRVNFKAEAVLQRFPSAVLLFLYRSPIAFATSHLINSENNKLMRQYYYRRVFFTSFANFNSWGLEDSFSSPYLANLIDQLGIRPLKSLRQFKSVEKLLLYWLLARRYSQRIVDRDTIGRTFAASYEAILDCQSNEFDQALKLVGINKQELFTGHLRSYSKGYQHNNPAWDSYATNAGFSKTELEIYVRKN